MKSPASTTLLTTVLAAAGLTADVLPTASLAGAGLYAAAVLVSCFLPQRRSVFVAAGICSALILLALVVSLVPKAADSMSWPALLLNRVLTLGAIWLVAYLGLALPQLRDRMAGLETRLSSVQRELTLTAERLEQSEQELAEAEERLAQSEQQLTAAAGKLAHTENRLEQHVEKSGAELGQANEQLQTQIAQRQRTERAAARRPVPVHQPGRQPAGSRDSQGPPRPFHVRQPLFLQSGGQALGGDSAARRIWICTSSTWPKNTAKTTCG